MERIRTNEIIPTSIQVKNLSSGLTYFEEGDIVMAKVTPCFENRNIGIIPKMVAYCGYGSSELFVYRTNSRVERKYLLFYLQTPEFIGVGVATMTGTGGLKRVSSTFAKNASFPLPPLSEQEAIVSYLEGKTAEIDRFVRKKEEQILRLKELREAIIAQAVTRGIQPDVALRPSNIPWLGDIPKHWEIKKIKYIFTERSEKGYPNEPILCSTQKYGVIPQSLYENRVVAVNKGLEGLKLVRKGDFVISLRSFQGGIEYAHYQGIISAAYTIIQLNERVNEEYLRHLMKSFPFIQLLQTCVVGIREGQNINYGLLRNQPLPLPPLAEQEAIVTYITQKTRQIDQLIESYRQEINDIKEFKQSLISDVVMGRINVQSD